MSNQKKQHIHVFLSMLLIFCGESLYSQDLKLWYTEPATKWTEALPIGNGKMGAMVFGGVEKDHLQFNEESLWTGKPRNYNKPDAHLYLDSIRQLLFAGKQAEAEKLAALHFMGTQSPSDDPKPWFDKVRQIVNHVHHPAQEHFDDSSWKKLAIPLHDGWEKGGLPGVDGAIWFRTNFRIPDAWLGKDLLIDLGKIRDQDFTYVNGKQIGTMHDSNTGRIYRIPKELVKAENHLAIQVINYNDKGGPVGYKDTTRLLAVYPEGTDKSQGIPLSKEWKYWIQRDDAPQVGAYQASYQPFADLYLTFNHTQPATQYKRELNLRDALCKTSYEVDRVAYERTYLASAPDQCIAIHLTANKAQQISFQATLRTLHKTYQFIQLDSQTVGIALQVKHGALKGVGLLRVKHQGGKLLIREGGLSLTGANEATLLLTAATNYKNYQDISADPLDMCTKRLKQLNNKSYADIKTNHKQDYQQYFNRFDIRFGAQQQASGALPTDQRIARFHDGSDPNMLALFMQYGRYLLISSSRPGSLPPNLQGIWNDLLSPPWDSKYTTNINAEMNYWLAEPTNLSDLQEPLFRMIKELSEAGSKTAKAYYNAPGWVLHHNTDLWKGTAPINNPNHGIWVTGGAWLCQQLWEHYLFTKDEQFLKEKAYPLMKASALFFDHFLIPDPNTGWLISTPSNSPEQGGLVAGPTMDHQIIRQLFQNVLAAAAILKVDTSFAQRLRLKSKQLAPNQIGRYGQLQEWLTDIDDPENKHRHVSHLWAVYPGSEINPEDSPKLMEAAKQSLIFRGDAGTGWSLAWKINLWARFRDAEHSYRMIQMLISPVEKGGGVYPNLFDAHPPFQIDGNFGGASGIAEMLLQSHLGYIDILPALPKALGDGEVKGICARSGFELSYRWKAGRLQQLEVLSKAGQVCKIHYGDRHVVFNTEKGKRYLLDEQLNMLNH